MTRELDARSTNDTDRIDLIARGRVMKDVLIALLHGNFSHDSMVEIRDAIGEIEWYMMEYREMELTIAIREARQLTIRMLE